MPTFARSPGLPFALAALVLALAIGCDHSKVSVVELDAGAHASPSSAPARWPVVVSIVVDQEAAWIADERWPLLPADGGFARLRREGTYAKDMRYAHSVTDTAPGHAALYTGAPPRVSGIWGNEVINPASHQKVSNPPGRRHEARLVGRPARVDRRLDGAAQGGYGGRSLPRRPSRRRDREPVFEGSRSDLRRRAGCDGDPLVRQNLDRFVTSNVLGGGFPAWATPLAVPDAVRAAPWTPLDPAWVQSHAATPDEQPGEGELGGMPIVFPHDVAHAKSVPDAFRGSPFADDAVLGLALAAMSAEHAGEHPTLIALSLSANDYIGHTFGPDSWEAWDELRRLDASLARFFTQLDERFGPDGWSAILTGDHGVTTMPEATAIPATRPWCLHQASGARSAKEADAGTDRWERACGKVGRLMAEPLTQELRDAAAKVLPGKTDPLVLGVVNPYVYLTASARGLGASDLERLKSALTSTLLRHPEVNRVIDTSTLPGDMPPRSRRERGRARVSRVRPGAGRRSLRPREAGELLRCKCRRRQRDQPRLCSPLQSIRPPARSRARAGASGESDRNADLVPRFRPHALHSARHRAPELRGCARARHREPEREETVKGSPRSTPAVFLTVMVLFDSPVRFGALR